MHSLKIRFFPFALVLYEVIVYLANDMYLPALPNISYELQASQTLTQYTLVLWFVGTGTVQLILGPLSDHYGRRLILLLGNLLFILSTLGCAITPNIYILLMARFLQGCTVTFVYVAGYSTIHELYSSKKSIQILAVISAISIIAPALGPILGALIAQYSNWRYIFWVLVWLGICSFAFLYVIMPNTNIQQHKFNFFHTINDYKKILKNADFLRFTLMFCFTLINFFTWIVESPFIFITHLQKSKIFFGLTQTIVFSCFALGTQIAKHLIIRCTVNQLLTRGLLLAFSGALLFRISIQITANISFPILSMSIIAIGTSMILGTLNRLTIESSTISTNKTVAMFSTIISIFSSVGSLAATFLNHRTFTGLASINLVCVSCAILLYITHKKNIILRDNF